LSARTVIPRLPQCGFFYGGLRNGRRVKAFTFVSAYQSLSAAPFKNNGKAAYLKAVFLIKNFF